MKFKGKFLLLALFMNLLLFLNLFVNAGKATLLLRTTVTVQCSKTAGVCHYMSIICKHRKLTIAIIFKM